MPWEADVEKRVASVLFGSPLYMNRSKGPSANALSAHQAFQDPCPKFCPIRQSSSFFFSPHCYTGTGLAILFDICLYPHSRL